MLEILKDEEVCSGCGNSTNYHIHEAHFGIDGSKERFAYCEHCDSNMEMEYVNNNNEYIMDELNGLFNTTQLNHDYGQNKWYNHGAYSKIALEALKKRLEVGAKKYKQDVPISESECLEYKRNNQLEAIEEIEDALIYQIAQWARDREFQEKHGMNVAVTQLHSMILTRLVKVYFMQCEVAEMMSNKLNVNNKKEIENNG